MWTLIATRIAQGVVVVWASYTIAFIILQLLPGADPVEILLSHGGEIGYIDPDELERLRSELGYDRPIIVQYLTGVLALFRGDLGVSVQTGLPVTQMILAAAPATATLAVAATVVGTLAGFVLAIAATSTKFSWLRDALLALPPIGSSLPIFWVGLILIDVVSFRMRLLPAFGSGGVEHLILPALTLSIPIAASVGQVLARRLQDVMREPFVETSIAKGATRTRALFAHALRNSLLPVVTIIGMMVANIITGAVVVETVFGRNGIGRITMEAMGLRDIPVVQGVVVFATIVFVLANLIVDLTYPLIDPRLRTARRSKAVRS